MRPPTTFKQEFLKKWLVGLKICGSSMKNMSFLQRKKTIKLSADVAMASARNGKTLWSKALIAKAAANSSSKQDDDENYNKILVEKMLVNITNNDSDDIHEKMRLQPSTTNQTSTTGIGSNNYFTSKKILRRSCSLRRIRSKCAPHRRVLASSIAKRIMVKKRAQVLKSLVPGGESMNDFSNFLEETLDYIFSLRAQVDVMRRFVNASDHQASNCK